jgi:monoterpene epsilon-lactone hydrolase
MLPCLHRIHDSSRRAYWIHRLLVALALAGTTAWFTAIASRAQTTSPVAREVPTRALPAPASVSQELQRLLAAPVSEKWDHPPTTVEEWTALVDQIARDPGPVLAEFEVEFEPVVVNGVNAYLLTPEAIPPENRNRLLMHLHAGCYMMFGGESAMVEGALLAGYGGFKVLSVDYRRPAEHRYPAALDDAVAVWTGALEMEAAERMGIFGASAGGALTLSTVLRLKQEGLLLPAAIAPGTPMADLTKNSDTFYTNRLVDNVLMGLEGRCQAMAEVYADGHDLRDPLAGLWRHERVSSDDSDDRYPRPVSERHHPRASQSLEGWRRDRPSRV